MGGGSYNSTLRSTRATSKGYTKVTANSLDMAFQQQKVGRIHESLDPNGVVIRESRDSDEHPESLAILLGIDVTGSMGEVPALLVRDGLPNMIQRIFDHGIEHPQVSFVAIGDHTCDNYPLQLGQFESSDEKLDESLTNIYIEGHGGGNEGESYILAWYHAAFHTAIDCHEKRGQKGILVTIGDEPPLKAVPGKKLAELYGLQSEKDYTAKELFEAASEKYDVYHINVGSTYAGKMGRNKMHWKELIGDRFINAEGHKVIPEIIGDLTAKSYKGKTADVPTKDDSGTSEPDSDKENGAEDKITL